MDPLRRLTLLLSLGVVLGCSKHDPAACKAAQEQAKEAWRQYLLSAQKSERSVGHAMMKARLDDWHANVKNEHLRPNPDDISDARKAAEKAVFAATGSAPLAASDAALKAARKARGTVERFAKSHYRDNSERNRVLTAHDRYLQQANSAAAASEKASKLCAKD